MVMIAVIIVRGNAGDEDIGDIEGVLHDDAVHMMLA